MLSSENQPVDFFNVARDRTGRATVRYRSMCSILVGNVVCRYVLVLYAGKTADEVREYNRYEVRTYCMTKVERCSSLTVALCARDVFTGCQIGKEHSRC
jgi:hypothetical protein